MQKEENLRRAEKIRCRADLRHLHGASPRQQEGRHRLGGGHVGAQSLNVEKTKQGNIFSPNLAKDFPPFKEQVTSVRHVRASAPCNTGKRGSAGTK